MEYTRIREGKAKLLIPEAEKLTKKTAEMPVFYNPVMKLNRDISVLLLNSINKKQMQIALPLAGSGIRGIRFLLELKKDKLKSIYFNDLNRTALKITEKCLKINNIRWDPLKIVIENRDANDFLLESKGFDYIDIDPFGSPNPFLDSAVKRLARGGILAVTATDTAALCGSSPKACMRKYFAKPMRNELMHELGLRILIRKVQLIGAQYEKALIPVFCYAKDHYMRAFFSASKSKSEVDNMLKQHMFFLFDNNTQEFRISEKNCENHFDFAGPLFAGFLWDKKLVEKMLKNAKERETKDYLSKIKEEMAVERVGFYDIPGICKRNKIKEQPKKEYLLKKLKGAETIFSDKGIKTDKSIKDVLKALRKA